MANCHRLIALTISVKSKNCKFNLFCYNLKIVKNGGSRISIKFISVVFMPN